MRRLIYDIEVCECKGTFWRPGYKISLSYNNVTDDARVICIAWKWEGEDEVFSDHWSRSQCDKGLVRRFLKVLHEADEVVGHNIVQFDNKWIRTRALFHGFPMPPRLTTQDTLTMARTYFRFPSNRLDAIAKYLGIGEKIKVGYDLWHYVHLENNRKSLEDMEDYCRHDVQVSETVWQYMMPYVPAKTHIGEVGSCPECGRWEDVVRDKKRTSVAGTKTVQLFCKACPKYFTVVASKLEG